MGRMLCHYLLLLHENVVFIFLNFPESLQGQKCHNDSKDDLDLCSTSYVLNKIIVTFNNNDCNNDDVDANDLINA